MHHLQQSQLYFWVKSTRGLTMLSKLQRGRQITRWQQRQLVRVGSTAFQILGDFLALINWRFLLWMLYVLLKLRMHERCLLLGDSTPHLYSLFPIISIAWCGWFGRVCIGQCVTWDIYFWLSSVNVDDITIADDTVGMYICKRNCYGWFILIVFVGVNIVVVKEVAVVE